MKIHILGGPGSGKTTLAREIAAAINIPHYDLDVIGRQFGTDGAAHVENAIAISRQPAWITEGVYLLFIDPLLHEADQIVLIDVAWPVAAWRIVRRHVANSLRGTNEYPGIKPLLNLLRYARRFYRNQRPDTDEAVRRYFAAYPTNTPRTPDAVLRRLEAYSALVIPPTAACARRYLQPYQHKLMIVRNNADRKRLLRRLAVR